MIPVTVITGYLGSGKTTLLARLLRDPAMSRTAVIINEFGEVGLDHDLVQTSDENLVQLSNGCLCCTVRSDLVATLSDLAVRRAAGTIPEFDRVVIETTGLADPAPILHALMTDRAVNEAYALAVVVTTVDAVVGLSTLDEHEESRRQAAVADRIIITKTDVPDADPVAVRERIAAMNTEATVIEAQHGVVPAAELFGADPSTPLPLRSGRTDKTVRGERSNAESNHEHHNHSQDISSFCIVRDEPVSAVALALFLEGLAENCGRDLLRMKGIVNVLEEPERPAVIHGVQHVYYAPTWLERWPSDDRRTRMVFIGRHIPERWVRGLLEVIEQEVNEETRRRSAAAELSI